MNSPNVSGNVPEGNNIFTALVIFWLLRIVFPMKSNFGCENVTLD